jgi:aspartyl-tRNA(Asn)/glutamyl-tRNA(Gln) amidotransferase subunit B
MPEPDIPAIDITPDVIDDISKKLIELPFEKEERYISKYGLSIYDSEVISSDLNISKYYDQLLEVLGDTKYAKSASNWLTGSVFSIANSKKIDINDVNIPISSLATLIKETEDKKVVKSKAEELLKESLLSGKDLKELLTDIKNQSEGISSNIDSIVDEVISENSKAVNDFRSGKDSSIGFLIGQVMQKSKGMANPNDVKSILIKRLNG